MRYAWEYAKAAHGRYGSTLSFEQAVGQAMAAGAYVHSDPDRFVIGYPVVLEPDGRMIHDDEHADTWFVYLAAMTPEFRARFRPTRMVQMFLDMAPYSLPNVVWTRRGNPKLIRHTWDRFEARIADQIYKLH